MTRFEKDLKDALAGNEIEILTRRKAEIDKLTAEGRAVSYTHLDVYKRQLFESEGVSGYTPQGFRPWQGVAGAFAEGAGASGCVCLNDQGGSRIDVTEDVAATLRAENHGHPPCVMGAAGFCTEHSAQARGIGYGEETSPTLRAGTVPAAVYENHSQDTRYTGPLETAPTVMSTYGTGGNNQPFVVELSLIHI